MRLRSTRETAATMTRFCGSQRRARQGELSNKGLPASRGPRSKVSQVLKGRASQRLYICGVDALKSLLFQRLKRGQSSAFRTRWTPAILKCSRPKVGHEILRGRPDRRFERIPGRRAETLDALVYALAAREGLAINLDMREEASSSPRERATGESDAVKVAGRGYESSNSVTA